MKHKYIWISTESILCIISIILIIVAFLVPCSSWREWVGTMASATIGLLGTLIVVYYSIINAKNQIQFQINSAKKKENIKNIKNNKEVIINETKSIKNFRHSLNNLLLPINIYIHNEDNAKMGKYNIVNYIQLYKVYKDYEKEIGDINNKIITSQRKISSSITKLEMLFNDDRFVNIIEKLTISFSNYNRYINTLFGSTFINNFVYNYTNKRGRDYDIYHQSINNGGEYNFNFTCGEVMSSFARGLQNIVNSLNDTINSIKNEKYLN